MELLKFLVPKSLKSADPSVALRQCVGDYLCSAKLPEERAFELDNQTIQVAYCWCVRDLIHSLKKEMNADPLKELSTKKLSDLDTVLNFYVVLALYPLLDIGVGIPLEDRIESHHLCAFTSQFEGEERLVELQNVVTCLNEVNNCEGLSHTAIPAKYMVDLVTALLQLAYGTAEVNPFATTARKELRHLLASLPREEAFLHIITLQAASFKVNKRSKSSVWLQRTTGMLLSQLLLAKQEKPSNLSTVDCLVVAMAKPGGHSESSSNVTLDRESVSRIAKAVSSIIVTVPRQMANKKHTYLKVVASQTSRYLSRGGAIVRPLDNLGLVGLAYQVGLQTVHEACRLHGNLGVELFLKPLVDCFKPIFQPCKVEPFSELSTVESFLADGAQIDRCLRISHDLVTAVCDGSSVAFEALQTLGFVWFVLSETLSRSDFSELQGYHHHVRQVLLSLLHQTFQKNEERIEFCLSLLDCEETNARFPRRLLFRPQLVQASVSVQPDAPLPLAAFLATDPASLEWPMRQITSLVDELVALLDSPASEDQDGEYWSLNYAADESLDQFSALASDLFLHIVSRLNEALAKKAGSEVFINEHAGGQQWRELATYASLASRMFERMSPRSVWPRSIQKIAAFFKLNFERIISTLKVGELPEEVRRMQQETAALLLGMLAYLLEELGRMKASDRVSRIRDEFASLITLLSELEELDSSAPHSQLAYHLRLSLQSRGVLEPTASGNEKPSLVQELVEEDKPLAAAKAESEMSPELREAFDQLRDPLVPVRGHALITVCRLLETRDESALAHEEKIYREAVTLLEDEDSYVYLNAIRCLTALGSQFTNRLLPVFLVRFEGEAGPSKRSLSVDSRLKMGEAVMRIVRNLGGMSSVYRDRVVAVFVRCSEDAEPLVRSACLSNLAELCFGLTFGIRPVVRELVLLVERHLTQDPETAVRAAAAFLASRMLGPQSKLPEWLPDDALRDLYHILSSRRKIERDPAVSEQLEAALAAFDVRARASVFASMDEPASLIKKIRILNSD